jgi:hypothetical protein
LTQPPRKDPLLELGCLIPGAIAITFFVYLAVEEPRDATISFWYIAVVVALLIACAAWSRRNPYSASARAFAIQEFERVRVAMGKRLDSLCLLSPREFEIALGRVFETQGWAVEVTPAVADGGKDLILKRSGRTTLVEAKRFAPGRRVGRPLLMKLHSAVVHERADAGMFVTTSDYTEPAREFAELNQIQMIDGNHLAAMLLSAYPEPQGPTHLSSMCTKCGAVVPFPDADLGAKPCPEGHSVPNPIPAHARTPERPACRECGCDMARVRIKGTRYYRLLCPSCKTGVTSWDS